MDFTPFKLDIDELLDDFTQGHSTTLKDMKSFWLARKFSYIYEARPSSNSYLFMQTLYSHSIGHLSSSASLSRRLGGLYCLYCLYETQPYKPPFKIYLSLGELKRLKSLVIDAKQNGIQVVPALVKRMLAGNMFLFGSLDTSDSDTKRVEEATKVQDKHLQAAYEKLLAHTGIEDYIHMNLGAELGLESFKKMSSEYAKAMEEAIQEAGKSMDVEDLKKMAENRKLASDVVEEIVGEWNAQKAAFYSEIGFNPSAVVVSADADGFAEVERLLDE
ncbi:hypothetical protein AXF42_Ash002007 [Apostasia shenzhenica]|uniref:Small nuclear RNA activating complex (SNAPc), subunit SNAP43 n=1 Tax=Apostasia shenzhenica TaxID=1088818 RepID=A0A2I0ABZ0_9ASPA|nr:hypothetical protein AXF42_Ash002007 [Apostasia shenzhenica]